MAAPILDGLQTSILLNQSIAASELFTVISDVGIDFFTVRDYQTNAASGYFTFDGVAIQQGATFQVAAADLGRLRYVAGNQIGYERFRITATDLNGDKDIGLTNATVYSVRPNTNAPYAKAKSFGLLADEWIAAASILLGLDPDGTPIQSFQVRDRNVDLGYFEFNGIAKQQGVFFTIPADKLVNLRYVSTGPSNSELFDVVAFDGVQHSFQSVGTATTVINANRPIVSYSTANVLGNRDIAIGSSLSIVDADGNSIKKYRFLNTSPHSNHGELVFQGVVQPRQTWFDVNANELGQVVFDAANRNMTQGIRVQAYDGKHWSNIDTLAITSTFVIPIVKPEFVSGQPSYIQEQLQNLPLRNIFSKQDPGPALSSYQILDPDTDPARGYFATNGIPLAGGQIRTLTAGQFANTSFVSGAFYDRALDTIYVRASNGTLWGDWEKVDIRTEPEIEDVLGTGRGWFNLLPKNILGQTIITFSFMQQFPDYETGEAKDDPEPEHFEIFDEAQRVGARIAFRHLESFANVQFVEVADSSTNLFGGTGGVIRMGEYGLEDSEAAAFAFFPGTAPQSGDMWFNRTFIYDDDGNLIDVVDPVLTYGTPGYEIFLHELGHAMGMKHPHDGTPRLPPTVDFNSFTVMSYETSPNGSSQTYQLYDIYRLQQMYGANQNFNAGNNVYSIATTFGGTQRFFQAIWDSDGEDTLSAVGSTRAAIIDLRSGQASTIGINQDNINIAFGSTIEHGIGSDLNDRMFGNAADNSLTGGAGNDYLFGNRGSDFLFGGAGDDTYEFGIADGFDVINEQVLGGLDTLLITPFPGLNSLADDFRFRLIGNDLIVELTLNGGASQGKVRVRNQTLAGNQVETLDLGGTRIDLENLTSLASTDFQKFDVLSTSSANGFLVAPV